MFLAAHRWELFDDSLIADLLGSPTGLVGRPFLSARGETGTAWNGAPSQSRASQSRAS